MRITASFTPAEARPGDVANATAVIIDVVRATSCIVEAIASGARGIFPTVSIRQATRLRTSLGRDRPLLCGERKGVRIDGFDMGNSPAEFTPAAVCGRQLVMTTTNGTRAFAAAAAADRVLAASFLNLSAVVDKVLEDTDVTVVCAGKEGRFALDDAVCAGHIIRGILGRFEGAVTLDDAAASAADLAGIYEVSAGMLARTEAGQALVEVGLGSDLVLCAKADRHQIVPMMHNHVIMATDP